jgi:hypothetical protein
VPPGNQGPSDSEDLPRAAAVSRGNRTASGSQGGPVAVAVSRGNRIPSDLEEVPRAGPVSRGKRIPWESEVGPSPVGVSRGNRIASGSGGVPRAAAVSRGDADAGAGGPAGFPGKPPTGSGPHRGPGPVPRGGAPEMRTAGCPSAACPGSGGPFPRPANDDNAPEGPRRRALPGRGGARRGVSSSRGPRGRGCRLGRSASGYPNRGSGSGVRAVREVAVAPPGAGGGLPKPTPRPPTAGRSPTSSAPVLRGVGLRDSVSPGNSDRRRPALRPRSDSVSPGNRDGPGDILPRAIPLVAGRPRRMTPGRRAGVCA